jgi:hypothetical protein
MDELWVLSLYRPMPLGVYDTGSEIGSDTIRAENAVRSLMFCLSLDSQQESFPRN